MRTSMAEMYENSRDRGNDSATGGARAVLPGTPASELSNPASHNCHRNGVGTVRRAAWRFFEYAGRGCRAYPVTRPSERPVYTFILPGGEKRLCVGTFSPIAEK